MKTISCLLMMIFGISTLIYADSYRRTTEDMYRESYAEEMQEHMVNSTAQIRAAQYRAMTEKCDQDHNCAPQSEQDSNGLGPFFHVPLWQ